MRWLLARKEKGRAAAATYIILELNWNYYHKGYDKDHLMTVQVAYQGNNQTNTVYPTLVF